MKQSMADRELKETQRSPDDLSDDSSMSSMSFAAASVLEYIESNSLEVL
jgi:hypothetical protein